jgi:hypothetical protein
VLSYPLYDLRSVLVGFLGYPMEVVYQYIFNLLVGLSLDPILTMNFKDFVVGSSSNGGSMEKPCIPLSFL